MPIKTKKSSLYSEIYDLKVSELKHVEKQRWFEIKNKLLNTILFVKIAKNIENCDNKYKQKKFYFT